MRFCVVFVISLTVTSATLTFVPRPITNKLRREPVRGIPISSSTKSNEGACACVQAISLVKSALLPGSLAMLNAANKHARSMAVRGRLLAPPIRKINAQKELPCGTFLSGASVGRARGTDIGATCARLWRTRKGARSLHVVIGSYRSGNGIVWCVALFGARTKFENSGACARVSCKDTTESKKVNMRVINISMTKN